MASRLTIAKPDIVKLFQGLANPILRRSEIGVILNDNREFWRLAKSTSLNAFIDYLLKSTELRQVSLALPHRSETLFVWGDVSPYVIAAAAKPDAYLCHYTAMHLHELTDQVPETIYANYEQRPLPHPSGAMTQQSIDNAFRRPQRMTNNIAPFGKHRLCLINGKHTELLGVITMQDKDGRSFPVTGLERTLIDITVRPAYAGGVSEVLEAFRRASGRVSLNTLSAMLKKMDYVYPYHQAIGFYLSRSGAYEPSRIELLRKEPFKFDFYLTYAMKDKDYSPEWRVFFPKGL